MVQQVEGMCAYSKPGLSDSENYLKGVAVKHGTPERGTTEYGTANPEW